MRNVFHRHTSFDGEVVFFQAPPSLLEVAAKARAEAQAWDDAQAQLVAAQSPKTTSNNAMSSVSSREQGSSAMDSKLPSSPAVTSTEPRLLSSRRPPSGRPIAANALIVKRVREQQFSPSRDYWDNGVGVCYDVRGDNPPVSLDSRQWGCLEDKYVVGKPLFRIFPLNRVGMLPPLEPVKK